MERSAVVLINPSRKRQRIARVQGLELHRPYTHLSSEAPRLPHQSRSSVLARSVHLHDDSELPERTNLTHSRHHRLAVPTFASVVDLVNSDDEGESKSSRDGANSAPISSGTEKEPIDLTTVPDPSPTDPISDAISNKKCPICMDSFNKITSTTCGHVFCRGCIRQAIRHQGRCPLCKTLLSRRNIHPLYL